MKFITTPMLQRMNTCREALEFFIRTFGQSLLPIEEMPFAKASIADVIKELHRNQRDAWEQSLLLSAQRRLVKALFKNGARPATDESLLWAAGFQECEYRVKLFLENGTKPSLESLISAIDKDNHRIARLLLKRGVNVAQESKVLLEKARSDNMVRLLVKHGA